MPGTGAQGGLYRPTGLLVPTDPYSPAGLCLTYLRCPVRCPVPWTSYT
jgi:hypothetical protein